MRKAFVWLILGLSLGWVSPLLAQDAATPTPAAAIPQVHVVAEGESLYGIAGQYGVSLADLERANNLTDASLLQIGQKLIIPGGAGEPVGVAYQVQVGDTLQGIADAFNTTPAAVAAGGGVINPDFLVAGQSLALSSQTGSADSRVTLGQVYVVGSADTLTSLAARAGLTPPALAALNALPFPTSLVPGQRLRLPGPTVFNDLPGAWQTVRAHPANPRTGETFALYVESAWEGQPAGRLFNSNAYSQTLRFAPHANGFVALVGLDAFAEPGLYTLEISGSGSRPWEPFSQPIYVTNVDYGFQTITVPEDQSMLLDPTVRAREDIFLAQYYGQFTPTLYWQGLFQPPGGAAVISALYGSARSYNGGPIQIFHTGVDFGGPVGQAVLAPAAGVVIFNAVTDLRGNVIILDHGLGITTGYYHLSESLVQVGDQIAAGQTIGRLGSTGLSTGPHLHWELRVNGVAVNPMQWLSTEFP